MSTADFDSFIPLLSPSEVDLLKKQANRIITSIKEERPHYAIETIIVYGNNWGEKRVFQYLDSTVGDKNCLLASEGIENSEFNYKQHYRLNFPNHPITPGRQEVINLIEDLEDEGKVSHDASNLGRSWVGLSGFIAFAIYNNNAKLFGLDNLDLHEMMRKLLKKEEEDFEEAYYGIARVRSMLMYSNLIKIMDETGTYASKVYMTGFHSKIFEQLAGKMNINYSTKFIGDLPPLITN